MIRLGRANDQRSFEVIVETTNSVPAWYRGQARRIQAFFNEYGHST